MSSTESWTIKRLLEWTTDYLQKNGSDSSRLDAEVLLAESLDCQRIELYTSYDKIPSDNELTVFRNWIKKRAEGSPVAYLVGHREFYSLPFEVCEDVLIPRPETELLVTSAIDFLSQRCSEDSFVCDVGTGSGCVAVAIAKNSSNAKVTAVDISEAAVQIATKNVESNNVGDQVVVMQSDLMSNISEPKLFDVIVSNPPYIGLSEKESLSPEVVEHEPHLALFAGQDGTDVISQLTLQSVERLKPEGKLLMEISPVIVDAVLNIVNSHSEFKNVEVQYDLSKLARIVSAVRIS